VSDGPAALVGQASTAVTVDHSAVAVRSAAADHSAVVDRSAAAVRSAAADRFAEPAETAVALHSALPAETALHASPVARIFARERGPLSEFQPLVVVPLAQLVVDVLNRTGALPVAVCWDGSPVILLRWSTDVPVRLPVFAHANHQLRQRLDLD